MYTIVSVYIINRESGMPMKSSISLRLVDNGPPVSLVELEIGNDGY